MQKLEEAGLMEVTLTDANKKDYFEKMQTGARAKNIDKNDKGDGDRYTMADVPDKISL